MPKMICEKCQIQLRPDHNGTLVIEMASFGEYKAWYADSWICPGCGATITAGFAENPIAEHFESNYAEKVNFEKSTCGRVVYSYEHLSDVLLEK
jgi:hypothetical protein